MRHYLTMLFWFFFIGYIVLALMGADGRPLEFLLGVLLFGMIDELYHNDIEKKEKRK